MTHMDVFAHIFYILYQKMLR